MASFPAVSGLEIDVTVVQGLDLIAKDRNVITRKRTSSDPYVEFFYDGKRHGKTQIIKKNVSPVWKETFKVKLGADAADKVLNGSGALLEFRLFDHDALTDDDPMGTVTIQLQSLLMEEATAKWYPVQQGAGKNYCKNAKGELELKIAVSGHKMKNLVRGNSQPVAGSIRVGLGWEMDGGQAIDLDTSCVAIDSRGNVLMHETVYYGNLKNSNGSITHSGDALTGSQKFQGGSADDEIIMCDLNNVPVSVLALHFILTVVTPEKTFKDIESASVTVINAQTGMGLCNFTPAFEGENTAMFLMRLSRGNNGWTMSIIEGTNNCARDFGTLVPEIKGYSRDLVPGLNIDPRERVAIMRKGGTIRVQDYCRTATSLPARLTFGLAWDVTDGVNIDLDASVICLNEKLELLDIIFWNQLRSKDGAIVHGGDEREGDEVGDDEKIFLHLNMVHKNVKFIGIVVNSYKGQELDDVASASCHLFDPKQGYDLAKYTLTNAKELDKHTALVMGCLYRGESGEWLLRIISEPAQGRLALDLVDQLQNFLRRNPPQAPAVVPEPEIVLDAMPEDVPIEDEIVVDPIVPVYEMATVSIGKSSGP